MSAKKRGKKTTTQGSEIKFVCDENGSLVEINIIGEKSEMCFSLYGKRKFKPKSGMPCAIKRGVK